MRFVPVVASAGLASVALCTAAPEAITQVREPQMRVLLHEGDHVVLRADQTQLMTVRGLPGGTREIRRLQLRRQGGGLMAVMDGQTRRLGAGTLLTVQNNDPRGIWLGQHRYQGALHISGRGGRLRGVNALGIETYLASVVGSEMPHQWPLAALQAQAVAARTYALRQRSRGGGWDVKATVASQVYRGLESVTPSTLEAVKTTHSLVLVHNGRLIDAVFHSSSGGITEASGMVWRRQHPYLVSVQDYDQHSPVHRWQERFDSLGLRQRLPEIGGVVGVDVLDRSSSGRVRQARLRGPRGSLVLKGTELRRRLGLKSTLVNFEMVAAQQNVPQRLRAPTSPAPVSSGSRIDLLTSSVAANVSRGPSRLLAPPPALLPKRVRGQGMQLLVSGQGFGHGVGMSQWGAHGLAEQGADFRSILLHYYRGAEVVPFRSHHDPGLASVPVLKPLWNS